MPSFGFWYDYVSFFHLAQLKSEGWAPNKGGVTETTQGHIRSIPLVDVKPELFRVESEMHLILW